MFDRNYVLPPYPISPSHVSVSGTIEEHRAPTDESVRLLKELEEKAEARILGRIDLQNGVKGTIFRRRLGFEDEIVMAFELNGQKYQTKPVAVPESYVLEKTEWARKLVEEMSKAIAIELLVHSKDFKILGKP